MMQMENKNAAMSRTTQIQDSAPSSTDGRGKTCSMPGFPSAQESAWPGLRAEAKLLKTLQALLGRLTKEERRDIIMHRMTQAQRLALERWMLKEAGSSMKSQTALPSKSSQQKMEVLRTSDTSRSEAKMSISKQSCPKWLTVHLGHGFYAVVFRTACGAGEAVNHLTKWAKESARTEAAIFTDQITAAVAQACEILRPRSNAELHAVKFRTRVSFGRKVRLSSPFQRNLTQALEDWVRLTDARTKADLRGDVSAEEGRSLWRQTTSVWMSIWEANGSKQRQLQRQLNEKEDACESMWKRLAALRRRNVRTMKSQAVQRRITRLLAQHDKICQRAAKESAAKCQRKRQRGPVAEPAVRWAKVSAGSRAPASASGALAASSSGAGRSPGGNALAAASMRLLPFAEAVTPAGPRARFRPAVESARSKAPAAASRE